MKLIALIALKMISLRQPHRDRYDIIKNILSIVANTQPIYRSQRHQTSIGYAANLTHPQTVRFLRELVHEGLLILTDSKPYSYYEITFKGKRCLQLFIELDNDMHSIFSDQSALG